MAVIPIPDENDKKRRGIKLVGNTLPVSLVDKITREDSHSKTHKFPLITGESRKDGVHRV